MAAKNLKFDVMADEIMHFGMSVSKNGYKSANIVIKKGDKEYMHIGYEWEGDNIPDFVMTLMGFVKGNEADITANKEKLTDDDKEYAKKKCCGGKKK